MANAANTAIIQTVEGMVRGLITKGGVSPELFFIGIHNAFAHGKIFEKADLSCTDEQLGALYEHIDALSKISEDIV